MKNLMLLCGCVIFAILSSCATLPHHLSQLSVDTSKKELIDTVIGSLVYDPYSDKIWYPKDESVIYNAYLKFVMDSSKPTPNAQSSPEFVAVYSNGIVNGTIVAKDTSSSVIKSGNVRFVESQFIIKSVKSYSNRWDIVPFLNKLATLSEERAPLKTHQGNSLLF